jgi:hypothetical protein
LMMKHLLFTKKHYLSDAKTFDTFNGHALDALGAFILLFIQAN